MKKNLLMLGMLCLALSSRVAAQTCTTNTSGSFSTTANWTCTPGFTYLTATTLNVQNAMTVSGTINLSATQALNITGSGSLTFGNNDKLNISNNAAIYLAGPSNTINGPGNNSNYQITINGTGVWGKSAGCGATLTGPGDLTTSNPCTIVPAAPLSLKLISFDAATAGRQVKISFTTAEEKDVAGFIVERSTNGKEYSSVSDLIAARNDYYTQNYIWTDEQPANGPNYYRLRINEQDNSYSYSNTATVNVKTDLSPALLYPNPVKENLTLEGSFAGTNSTITIEDMIGRTYITQAAGDASTVNINVASLIPGNYIVKLTGTTATQYMRFVKY